MKRFVKLLLLFAFVLPVGILFSGCDSEYTLVKGVDFNKEEIYLTVGHTADLSYKLYPANSNNQSVNFFSSDESVAYVDQTGKVTLRGNGEAIVTIRTVDGGFVDTCKVISLVDPHSISFKDTNIKEKRNSLGELEYYYTFISVNEVRKLPVIFLDEEDKENIKITNKNIIYTTDNAKNVSVINSTGGVIKGVSNQIFSPDATSPYSTITATLTASNTGRVVTASIRVYVTENASADNLFISPYTGEAISNQSTFGLSSSNTEGELFKAYLLDFAGWDSDFDIFFESSNPDIFVVETDVLDELPNPPVENVQYFKIVPGNIEGEAILYITISSSDEDGYQIRTYINISVEGDVHSAVAKAKDIKTSVVIDEVSYQTLSVGSIFSLELDYFDKDGEPLSNVERDVLYGIPRNYSDYILNFGELMSADTEYFYYSTNKFKILEPISDKLNIVVQIAKTRSETNIEIITASFDFYIKAEFDGVLVTETEDGEVGVLQLLINNNTTRTLYVQTFSKLGRGGDPVSVSANIEGTEGIIELSLENGTCTITTNNDIGINTIIFSATDGSVVVEYRLVVHVL